MGGKDMLPYFNDWSVEMNVDLSHQCSFVANFVSLLSITLYKVMKN